jgi:hypothetical protein
MDQAKAPVPQLALGGTDAESLAYYFAQLKKRSGDPEKNEGISGWNQ